MSTYAYPNPQAIFYQQYNAARRDEVVGILLALFLGDFGAHHFYMRRTGLGILYLCFFWTGIPAILGFIECFFMPGRVREFNSIQAAAIAASLGIAVPGWGQPVNMPPAGAGPNAEQGRWLACQHTRSHPCWLQWRRHTRRPWCKPPARAASAPTHRGQGSAVDAGWRCRSRDQGNRDQKARRSDGAQRSTPRQIFPRQVMRQARERRSASPR